MAQLGADDVEVDRLATTFDRTAARLATSEESITTSVQSVTWVGPDADAFRSKLKAQLSTVSERLTTVAKELRAQAEAQRTASDGSDVPTTPTWFDKALDAAEDWLRDRVETMRKNAALNEWAEGVGRRQIREMADESPREQMDWWKGLTPDQQQALLRTDPGALFGLEGLPAGVRAEARNAYLDSVRGDIQISSSEDKLAGELNIAWVHLGVEGTAGIVQLADGTYRVDLKLDGEIGANIGKGAKGEVSLGGGVAQSYTFNSQAEAEAFVNGLYDKLTPDADWSMFGGPGAVMADTVDDVVGYLGDHSDQRTKFEGEIRIEGGVELELGAFDVNLEGQAGARYDFDSSETTLFVGGKASGELALPSVAPVDGAGDTGSVSLSTDVEAAVKFDANGQISELSLTGTLAGQSSVGIEQFFGGTNASSKVPESFNLSLDGGGEVKFDAKLDLQDPIVQQQAAALLNSMGNGGISLDQLQSLLGESELQVQVNATSTTSDNWDIGIASLEISETNSQNVVTWVKPPGGDFTHVTQDELTADRR
jgi:hypothetical protein